MNDPEKLREWFIKQSDDLLILVGKTNTSIDDKIVGWIKKIAMNEKAFTAIYQLLRLVWNFEPDGQTQTDANGQPVFGTSEMFTSDVFEAQQDAVNALIDGDSSKPQDAMSIIMAIGVIIQIISAIREWKKNREAV